MRFVAFILLGFTFYLKELKPNLGNSCSQTSSTHTVRADHVQGALCQNTTFSSKTSSAGGTAWSLFFVQLLTVKITNNCIRVWHLDFSTVPNISSVQTNPTGERWHRDLGQLKNHRKGIKAATSQLSQP